MTCAECIDSLGPYIDGELLREEAAGIAEHIETCADCAAAHRRLVATSSQLKNGLTRYRAPDVLKARIRAALAQPEVESKVRYAQVPRFRDINWRRAITAAAVVAVVSSAVTLSVVDRKPAGETVQSELLSSHIRSLMPGHLTDVASNDQHNVKPWFNGRVDMSPTVPRLDSLGFPLIGGRIDYIDGRSVPVIVYTRRQHVINVYSWPATTKNQAPHTASSHGYNLIQISREGEQLWIVSDLNRNELEQFGRLFVGRTR